MDTNGVKQVRLSLVADDMTLCLKERKALPELPREALSGGRKQRAGEVEDPCARAPPDPSTQIHDITKEKHDGPRHCYPCKRSTRALQFSLGEEKCIF